MSLDKLVDTEHTTRTQSGHDDVLPDRHAIWNTAASWASRMYTGGTPAVLPSSHFAAQVVYVARNFVPLQPRRESSKFGHSPGGLYRLGRLGGDLSHHEIRHVWDA